MTSRISELVIDCHDPERAAAFWCGVLGYRVLERDETAVEIAGEPAAPTLLFSRSDDPKTVKNRLHIDVNATDRDQMEEVARLEGLGARRIDIGQGEPTWVVMADPDGNEFCVLRRRLPPEPEPFHE